MRSPVRRRAGPVGPSSLWDEAGFAVDQRGRRPGAATVGRTRPARSRRSASTGQPERRHASPAGDPTARSDGPARGRRPAGADGPAAGGRPAARRRGTGHRPRAAPLDARRPRPARGCRRGPADVAPPAARSRRRPPSSVRRPEPMAAICSFRCWSSSPSWSSFRRPALPSDPRQAADRRRRRPVGTGPTTAVRTSPLPRPPTARRRPSRAPAIRADPAAAPGAVPDLTNQRRGRAPGRLDRRRRAARRARFVAAGPAPGTSFPGPTPTIGTGRAAPTYTIEVEDGLQTAEQDHAFAAAVDATLADPAIVDRRRPGQPDPDRHR